MRRSCTLRVCLLIVAGLCLTACRSTAKAGLAESGDIAGVYQLVSVDGLDVPATVRHGKVEIEVYSGAFTINADGTCRSLMHFGRVGDEPGDRIVTATYARDGGTLNMRWENGGRTVGTIEGDTFSMINEGMTYVYRLPDAAM